ncbi:ADP-dependent (S)-NAD(P)H-hydrate dehydratase / NAD(P)H-hydrate epimerase [Hyphomicrobiales bacterium]|nr:ADP-dependent (S)-NAD(P)H-hydrate dehydratase / NAD(P)H-hydrate epimerase [Hyphomicrobiales bacterium]CAH1701704.1 ADP-dependent (S)-NAD(P)H-hydrate dehydratase,NAD(P)H-hydrate epimerase [Hyphomicrobiales bacterium]CAI0345860.1 ADP-dependent (S)-NAD(P)H-hydrate dehydratase / NAD(P)H-hydrate epimerase [Hyphomicrobiales bacterium]
MPAQMTDAMKTDDLALLTTDQMRRADGIAIAAGTAGIVLMERAGRAVAEAVLRRVGAGASVAVAGGPGNNGGDGFVAARILRENGLNVRMLLLGAPQALQGDAAIAFARWNAPVEPLASIGEVPADLFVDALFGAGLTRALSGEAAEAVAFMNAAGRPVIAVDVPSGLSGDTGQAEGPVIRANETVTFFRLKPGHLLLPGRELCGDVVVADIGIPAEAALREIAPAAFGNACPLWRAAWPHHGRGTHKFRRGAVAVVAGGNGGVGAPRLSARAALRIGAGLATILCAPEALAAHALRGPDALMQRPIETGEALSQFLLDRRVSAILAGPALGLDERAAALIRTALASDAPVVLDADALTWLATARGEGGMERRRDRPWVLTPHEGEFQRLFGNEPEIAGEKSKLERARKAAALCEAVIVYKGADTVIAGPDGRAAINVTGSPALATAGSGDVLAGLIAGLIAQGMAAFEAACAAVWLHGRAGEALGMGLIADDLPEAIPPLLREFSLA